ncbi:class I SAM-dependent methyltransferase [Sorangium sp. So ce887]|uniref:class I SAM-dependent methyltransferase n=1 Tax=Sorangium sp. So ce887 TaxID=3133324 RepID=UPI003F631756
MRSPHALLALALAALTGCGAAPPAAPPAPLATPAGQPDTAPATATSPPSDATASAPSQATSVEVPPALRAVVDAADRADADRALDVGRKPAETLAFFGIQPGMKVAELEAGGGYTAELLARAVGPGGAVYAQNNRFVLERFAEKPWSERLKKPVMKPVVRVDRELDDPLPPEARDLDAVFFILFYHDTVWMETDRAAMNRAIFRALKPGGVYAIIDHAGREGTGVADVKTLHRIEEKVVREEIERAGFRLAAEASFLRSPTDTRDWNASPMVAGEKRGTSDRFVLKFVKPGG